MESSNSELQRTPQLQCSTLRDPEHRRDPPKGRTIIMCYEGTGKVFGMNSTVGRLLESLDKGHSDQVIYYRAGATTHNPFNNHIHSRLWSRISTAFDAAFAWNVAHQVKDGYQFLMRTYRSGDKICLFGFSRGAYTARALSGMLYKVGLLPPDNVEQVDFAFNIYKTGNIRGARLAREFKQTFSISVNVHFLGVWESSASLGLVPRYLPYSTQNDGVKYFRHALALDECRGYFRPNLWGEPLGFGESLGAASEVTKASPNAWAPKPPTITDVKEVWFAGSHSDVGGGYTKFTPTTIGKISLRWMIKECFLTNTGILFDPKVLGSNLGMELEDLKEDPNRVRTYHISASDMFNEQMIPPTKWFDIFCTFWWIAECIFLVFGLRMHADVWSHLRRRNFRDGRWLTKDSGRILVHRSVEARISSKKIHPGYSPKLSDWKSISDSKAIDWVD